MPALSPAEVLYDGAAPPALLPCCDHYAGSEKLMRKSLALQAELGPVFDVTLDCEDGAAVGREAAHAELVAAMLGDAANRFGRAGVRIHDFSHPHWRDDLRIVLRAARPPAYITLPKTTDAADVAEVCAFIEGTRRELGIARPIPADVLIETHGALAQVARIAALPAVSTLSFGLMDFVSAHHGAIPDAAMRAPGQFDHPLVRRAKLEIAAACHAHGKTPSHNVTTEIREMAMVASDAARARDEFGYTRMWSIHPAQIREIVAAFAPREAEVALAAEILLAAQAADWGPTRHRDTLHDRASYRYYWSVLRRAHAAGAALPAEVARWLPAEAAGAAGSQACA
ncbi:HpcH/HpaI aldolase/citrate lyase family protein [Burkholderia glumae]|uniref:Aldolase/citrate lyase family protein n=1 Tax=Burkholderia glumae TaxID=337 RepID=A0ABY5B9E8_BURGL|nr:aldolase/citrate lyase family protein [Burkholderia glumae]ACR31235.1 HpcH/HpaI aldolase [Burkholderia glumae BGR1]KHJ63727.1 aldolase [Burkholderia glumae]MCM2483435.1 aldolase/citrate lyase family protein [Burkholderia glumae]MCM2511337.1 aldolase/citrate lyase family protein [Burkholderia glumae]MCM2541218.1 aldolase/citrate lyase family protein [Burkholderia glumae]